jgi:uncharacterized membrane protein YuzA (DUF378 family)
MAKMEWYDLVAYLLLVVAALNWGLVAFFNINLVEALANLVKWDLLAKILYGAVTAAGIYALFMFVKLIRE